MEMKNQLEIQFNNGSELSIAFPKQIKHSMAALMDSIKSALDSDKLVLEIEGKVTVIPWSSIKLIQVTGVDTKALPFGAIKGAEIVPQQ